jgi:hypothetical protein
MCACKPDLRKSISSAMWSKSAPHGTVYETNGSMAMAILKVLLIVAALAGIGFSVVAIDLPNGNYYWVAFEVVVALLLVPVAISNLKVAFGGKR